MVASSQLGKLFLLSQVSFEILLFTSALITVAKDLPTYGYRRVWAILSFQGSIAAHEW